MAGMNFLKTLRILESEVLCEGAGYGKTARIVLQSVIEVVEKGYFTTRKSWAGVK